MKGRQIAGAWLLLPFLFASAIPQGFMPSSTSDSWFTVTICTSDGLRTVVLDETGQEVPDPIGQDKKQASGNQCVFSALAAYVIQTLTYAETFGVIRVSLHWSVVSGDLAQRKIYASPGARAPPIFA